MDDAKHLAAVRKTLRFWLANETRSMSVPIAANGEIGILALVLELAFSAGISLNYLVNRRIVDKEPLIKQILKAIDEGEEFVKDLKERKRDVS